MIYANSHNTEIRGRLKLRSTARGANNRLDVESIVSFDKADGISVPVLGGFSSSALLSRQLTSALQPCFDLTAWLWPLYKSDQVACEGCEDDVQEYQCKSRISVSKPVLTFCELLVLVQVVNKMKRRTCSSFCSSLVLVPIREAQAHLYLCTGTGLVTVI